MVDLLGLSVAALAIFLSIYYWWSQNRPSAAEKRSVALSKGSGKKEGDDVQSTQQQQGQKKGVKSNINTIVKPKKHPAKNKGKSKKISSHPRFLRRYGGHAGRLTAYAVSPDGKWLATAGIDGRIQVHNVDEPGFDLSCTVKTAGTGVFQDHLSAISWLPMVDDGKNNHPTVVGFIDRARQVAFFRIRRKKDAAASASVRGRYELIELAKRRFDVSGRIEAGDRATDCLADRSHPNDHLIFTKTEYDPKRPQGRHPNTIAWNGETGREAGAANTSGPGLRTSPDGTFLCGGGGVGASEAKVYEVRRKKVKGEAEPAFDSMSSKHVMSLVPRTTSSKVADVALCGERHGVKLHRTRLGILACEDGTVEVWDLDADHRNGEDPKFLSAARLFGDDRDGDGGPEVVSAAASGAAGDDDGLYRVAVATGDSALHLLSYHVRRTEIVADFAIEETHRDEGVGGMHFCPASGNVLYSTGENNSREVYSWKLS